MVSRTNSERDSAGDKVIKIDRGSNTTTFHSKLENHLGSTSLGASRLMKTKKKPIKKIKIKTLKRSPPL